MLKRTTIALVAVGLIAGCGEATTQHQSAQSVAPEVCEHQGSVRDVIVVGSEPFAHVVCASGVVMEVKR